MPKFSIASKKQLSTSHPKLQMLFNEVIKHWDCTVIEGKRTIEAQRINVANGASRTMNSQHLPKEDGYSYALDVSPYPIKWTDYNRFYAFAGFVIGIATQLGINIRWGGDWDSDRDFSDQTFNDLVHFEYRGE